MGIEKGWNFEKPHGWGAVVKYWLQRFATMHSCLTLNLTLTAIVHNCCCELEGRNMAKNRLYLVDTCTKEFLCLAKGRGVGWGIGNLDLYEKFMRTRIDGVVTNLVVGAENDDAFFDKWIKNGINYNETNKWD